MLKLHKNNIKLTLMKWLFYDEKELMIKNADATITSWSWWAEIDFDDDSNDQVDWDEQFQWQQFWWFDNWSVNKFNSMLKCSFQFMNYFFVVCRVKEEQTSWV